VRLGRDSSNRVLSLYIKDLRVGGTPSPRGKRMMKDTPKFTPPWFRNVDFSSTLLKGRRLYCLRKGDQCKKGEGQDLHGNLNNGKIHPQANVGGFLF